MSDKDYSLLRPFDLEAAKRGEALVFIECGEMKDRKFIAGPDSDGSIIIQDECGRFGVSASFPYNMAPLCWVEGKPVYKGDVLFDDYGRKVVSAANSLDGWLLSEEKITFRADKCTWAPPKVKREGYTLVQKASVHGNKADAESFLHLLGEPDRWVVCAVEWEEQP